MDNGECLREVSTKATLQHDFHIRCPETPAFCSDFPSSTRSPQEEAVLHNARGLLFRSPAGNLLLLQ